MKIINYLFLLFFSALGAEVSLGHLSQSDKESCLHRLREANEVELWDVFLKGQAELFLDGGEMQWLSQNQWWLESKNVLELGCGNGFYLSRLAAQFTDKQFQGVDILPASIKQAKELFRESRVSFYEGDCELSDPQRKSSADGVIFRLTLQHLKNPFLALEHAWDILTPGGHLLIVDACDSARKSSHLIPAVENFTRLVIERQQLGKNRGKRKIAIELVQELETKGSPLNELYELVFSNINSSGELTSEIICFEGKQTRERYFNHNLLILTLFQRKHQIPLDWDQAYDEIREYLEDETAWTIPGMAILVLKKKP